MHRKAATLIGHGPAISGLYLASVFALGIVMVLGTSQTAYRPLAICAGVLFTSLLVLEWKRVGHPLTPAGVIALGGLLVFFLRPLTIASSGLTTAGAEADTRVFSGSTADASTLAMIQVLLFFSAFSLVYVVMTWRPAREKEARATPVVTDRQVRRAATVLIAAVMFSGGLALYLVVSSGGIATFLQGLSLRSSFLAGKFFLTLGYIPLSVTLVLYLLTRRAHPKLPTWNKLAIFALVVLVLSAFTGGGRGPIILGVLLPLLVVKQMGPKPLRTPTLLGTGLAVVVAAMIMSLFLRENEFTNGGAVRDLKTNPVETLGGRLTSGAETRPFDSLIVLNQAGIQGQLEKQNGMTYAKTPTWFLPGSIAPSKGGANTWFTRTYLPRFYFPDRIETSISAPGEAYANFGWAGIPIVGALLGAAASAFTRRRASSILGATLTAVLTPVFFSFIRSDAYQNGSLALIFLFVAVVGYRLTIPPTPKTTRHQEQLERLRRDVHASAMASPRTSRTTPR